MFQYQKKTSEGIYFYKDGKFPRLLKERKPIFRQATTRVMNKPYEPVSHLVAKGTSMAGVKQRLFLATASNPRKKERR